MSELRDDDSNVMLFTNLADETRMAVINAYRDDPTDFAAQMKPLLTLIKAVADEVSRRWRR